MTPIPTSILDHVLTLQLTVAWAGEANTDPPRLGWWRTSMTDEFGGVDLFKRLAPDTWRWATLQAAREAARRVDARARAGAADPDRLVSLFRLGFEVDEQLDDRLVDLKHHAPDPVAALPGLSVTQRWSRAAFDTWLADLGAVRHEVTPSGRRVRAPEPLDLRARHLAAALAPSGDRYPLPHVLR